MAYDVSVREAHTKGVVTVDASATTFLAGQLLGHSGSAWVKADADTPSYYAQWVCLDSVSAGGSATYQMPVAKNAVLVDLDAPYTLGGTCFLSATAGAITQTRPAPSAGNTLLVQVVGMAIDTSTLHIVLNPPREMAVPLVTTRATSAGALLDSGDFGGPTLDAQNETLNLFAVIPENAVSLTIAKLYLAAEATAGTPTMDVTISSAIDGAQWDAVSADATLVDLAREDASAADAMQVTDITLGFDATNIFRPGAAIGIKCLQDDAGTDISFVFGGVMYVKVV